MIDDNLLIEKLIDLFFTEMNLWEKYCKKVDDNDTLSTEEKSSKQILKATELVNRFLTKRKRERGLPNNISYGYEGSYKYNKEEEKIISIDLEGNKATVLTERETPLAGSNKYIIKKVNGNWKIDSKKRYSLWKKKWENAII